MPVCRSDSWYFTLQSGPRTRITKKAMPSIWINGRQRFPDITKIKNDKPFGSSFFHQDYFLNRLTWIIWGGKIQSMYSLHTIPFHSLNDMGNILSDQYR